MSSDTTTAEAGGLGALGKAISGNPAATQLVDAARGYVSARSGRAVQGLGDKVEAFAGSLEKRADDGGLLGPGATAAAKKLAVGAGPAKAAMTGLGVGAKKKVKDLFGKGGGSGAPKMTSIIEQVDVGVPVSVAYDQWTQFEEFSSFMKGVESVEQKDEVESTWRIKVFKSRRTWTGRVTEQVPDRRIQWTSEGAKGSTKGVVTFHPLVDDLTRVVLVLEYYPAGFMEKTGNLWRAGGRRARLDLKHYQRFVMMRGEATGSWRGEIRDGEVVSGPDDDREDPEQDERRDEREEPQASGSDEAEQEEMGQAQTDQQEEREPAPVS
jgi:uncharacterized membrane protein